MSCRKAAEYPHEGFDILRPGNRPLTIDDERRDRRHAAIRRGSEGCIEPTMVLGDRALGSGYPDRLREANEGGRVAEVGAFLEVGAEQQVGQRPLRGGARLSERVFEK